jgi:hypothetical protein
VEPDVAAVFELSDGVYQGIGEVTVILAEPQEDGVGDVVVILADQILAGDLLDGLTESLINVVAVADLLDDRGWKPSRAAGLVRSSVLITASGITGRAYRVPDLADQTPRVLTCNSLGLRLMEAGCRDPPPGQAAPCPRP